MRRPRPPIRGEMIVLAAIAGACSGDLHPFRAVGGPDGSTVSDGGTGASDTSVTPDALAACPDPGPVGYATMSDQGGEWDGGATGAPTLVVAGGVTGGGTTAPVVVDASDTNALAAFTMYASDKMPGPLTIEVRGMIAIPPTPDGGSTDVEKIRVSSNKSVVGAADRASGFTGGGLVLTGVSNVILRNLVIGSPNPDASSNVDAIHVETSHQIWIDHCDLSSSGPTTGSGAAYDGLIDISDGSDFVTVSWTHYHDHPDTGLLGRSDSAAAAAEDAGKNHVTYDHDWFDNVRTGPRLRFGAIHVLNTFFKIVTNYGVASTDGATVVVEKSYFRDVTPAQTNANFGPITTLLDGATAGSVALIDNQADGSSGPNVITTPQVTAMIPYPYTSDSSDTVPFVVSRCTGAGVVPPLPPTN